ncbi:MAG: type II toxin-antitoxin system RelE/ParE family toxin [Legionellales bacterium]|nr:type II toxin-antitoxin system RelE/ParE family toxin [Legionellales bacterium]
MYTVKYSRQSIKTLQRLPKPLADRIMDKIKKLKQSPYHDPQVKALKGLDAFRLRVGDWRIIYSINEGCLEILIIKIAPRGEAYK